MPKAATKAPHLIKRDIQEFLALEEERKSLERQAAALKKRAAMISAKMFDFVRANGGKERSVVRSGYMLAIEDARGSVAWKQEFIEVAGEAEAERLIAAAPTKERLSVRSV